MTWSNGASLSSDGWQLIITDAYPEPVWITDAEIRADEADRERSELAR